MTSETGILSECAHFLTSTGAVITGIVQTLATIGAVLIARSGLQTWRKQLHGSDEYSVAIETLSACWALRGAMKAVHHHDMTDQEIDRYSSDFDDIDERLARQDRTAQALEARISPIIEAQHRLNEISPRLAAIIDPELLNYTSAMIFQSKNFFVSLEQIKNNLENAKNSGERLQLFYAASNISKHLEELKGKGAEASTRKASTALRKIEEELKPYTPKRRASKLFSRVN